jgi:hypothetical protein
LSKNPSGAGNQVSTITLKLNDQATQGLKQIQKDGKQVDKEMNDRRVKLAALWAAGNQLATMLLGQMARAAEGTARQAQIQKVLSGFQLIQSEFAVVQAQKQAIIAFASQNYIQGAILQALAIGMQSAVIQAQVNQQAANTAQKAAESYQASVDTWRQSYN